MSLNKPILLLVVSVAILLGIPFIAMQFTSEFNWSLLDFVVMGGLLLG